MAFLIAELELGLTFMDVAATSASTDTTRRNQAHARVAYETVLGLKNQVPLTATEEALVNEKLDLLKARLDSASSTGVTPPD
jgi:hypothetical protein